MPPQQRSVKAAAQAALLNASAKMISELLVLADADALWLLCDAGRAAVVMQTLERYRFSEEVALTNHERRSAVLALQGPRALEMLLPLAVAPATSRWGIPSRFAVATLPSA